MSKSPSTGPPPPPLVCLTTVGREGGSGPTVTARIQLSISGQPVRFEITVPTEPVRLRELLPAFQGLTDVAVQIAVRNTEQEGWAVSCQKGCGACCRQPVPISESEARAIRQLVDSMPEPRCSQVRTRFHEARVRLAAAGLLEPFLRPTQRGATEKQALAMSYFRLGLACPFLVDESCSIHPNRPVACREYLVTSAALCCARPTAETIRILPMPAKVSGVLRAMDKATSESGTGWLALSLALDWSQAHPQEALLRPGPAWVEEFFKLLAKATG